MKRQKCHERTPLITESITSAVALMSSKFKLVRLHARWQYSRSAQVYSGPLYYAVLGPCAWAAHYERTTWKSKSKEERESRVSARFTIYVMKTMFMKRLWIIANGCSQEVLIIWKIMSHIAFQNCIRKSIIAFQYENVINLQIWH